MSYYYLMSLEMAREHGYIPKTIPEELFESDNCI